MGVDVTGVSKNVLEAIDKCTGLTPIAKKRSTQTSMTLYASKNVSNTNSSRTSSRPNVATAQDLKRPLDTNNASTDTPPKKAKIAPKQTSIIAYKPNIEDTADSEYWICRAPNCNNSWQDEINGNYGGICFIIASPCYMSHIFNLVCNILLFQVKLHVTLL